MIQPAAAKLLFERDPRCIEITWDGEEIYLVLEHPSRQREEMVVREYKQRSVTRFLLERLQDRLASEPPVTFKREDVLASETP